MGDFFKAVPLSFLMRSAFAGCFFLVAFRAPGPIWAFPPNEKLHEAVLYLAVIALLAGVTAYTLHRAVIYPPLQRLLRRLATVVEKRTGQLVSLVAAQENEEPKTQGSLFISASSIDDYVKKWGDSKSAKVSEWADNIHYLYVSCWSVGIGSWARTQIDPGSYFVDWRLVGLAAVLGSAGFISDYRLQFIHRALGYSPQRTPNEKTQAGGAAGDA